MYVYPVHLYILFLTLFFQKGELKLADFGLARAFGIPVRQYSAEVSDPIPSGMWLIYTELHNCCSCTGLSTILNVWGAYKTNIESIQEGLVP